MNEPLSTLRDPGPVPPIGNFPIAFVAGLVAAIAGAAGWATLTLVTDSQFGIVAVGLGFLVGVVIRIAGGGQSVLFQATGAVLALVSCLLGNVLTVIGFAAQNNGLGYFQAIQLVPLDTYPDLLRDFVGPIDLLFYGLAAWCGWKYSVVEDVTLGPPPQAESKP